MTEHIISVKEMASFLTKALITAGADPEHAAKHASLLVTADYRGHYSHGLNRLGNYYQLTIIPIVSVNFSCRNVHRATDQKVVQCSRRTYHTAGECGHCLGRRQQPIGCCGRNLLHGVGHKESQGSRHRFRHCQG